MPRVEQSDAPSFEEAQPQEILAWALERYRSRIVLSCSFGGPTGIVALDLALRIDPALPVYVLDTGLLFEPTHALIRRVAERYGIEPILVSPQRSVDEQNAREGRNLWERDPDRCCALRKLEPQRAFLSTYDAWITAVRRDQTPQRRTTPAVSWSAEFDVVKICPFVAWTESDVWSYVRRHDLPYNALHDAGYPSVGCIPCTRAVAGEEATRDGRWPGHFKTECGLHGR